VAIKVSDPNSPDEWFQLADHHRRTAQLVAKDKIAAGQACFHAGLAVECALKAYIMHRERLNGWPSREARQDLYIHNLRKLWEIAGLQLDTHSAQAPSWHLFLQWDRGQGYDPKPMPRKVAQSWIEAAFGPNGLVTWIRQLCR
jgi:hypothetical protein